MRGISTCFNPGHFHPTFFHLLKRKVIQFCAYSTVLVFRMDGEQLNLSSFILDVQFICQKANNYSIQFCNPDNVFFTVFTNHFDSISLTGSPIRPNQCIDSVTQYLLK